MTDQPPDPDAKARATHRADQQAGAAAQAQAEAMRLVHNLAPGEWATVSRTTPPPWLVEFFARHNAAIAAGDGVGCAHVDGHDVPTVVNLAAWRPGVIACTDCTLHGAFYDPAQNNVCDACGTTVATLFVAAFQFGNKIVRYGVCMPCEKAGC